MLNLLNLNIEEINGNRVIKRGQYFQIRENAAYY